MKATGEVMAIANSFEGALMKAIRSLELNVRALKLDKLEGLYTDEIEDLLVQVTDERLFVVAEALRRGFSPRRSTTSPRWTSGSWTASSGSSTWRTSCPAVRVSPIWTP